MERLEIKELYSGAADYAEKSVTVCGWVKTIRSSKSLGFIELNDGSNFGNLQVVFEDNKLDNFKEITKLNVGCALVVTGTVVLTPDAKQPFEIHAEKILVEGASTSDYPLQKKRHSLEFLRIIAHLRPRTNTFHAAFRVRSVAAFAIHRFFQERGFVYAHTPLITGSDAEGAGEMFRITTLDDKNPPLTPSGEVDYSQDFFGKDDQLDGFRAAGGGVYGDGFWQGVHFWPDIPCGKELYRPPCSGILDGRAGNCICRSA